MILGRLKRVATRPEAILVGILVLAFGLRLAWVLHAQTQPLGNADTGWYYATASNVAAGHGFTVNIAGDQWVAGPGGNATSFLPPGWPLSLGAAFALFGTHLLVAKLLNVVAGVITVYLAYRIGELLFGRTAGLLGAALLAFYPSLIYWSSTVYSDIYFTMWFSLAVFVLLRTREMTGRRLIAGTVLLGLVTGVATLTRGQGVLLVPLVFVFWALFRGWRQAFEWAALVVAGAAVVVLPWTVRNVATFHAPVVVSVNDGFNLRIGHSPYATGRYIVPQDLWTMDPGISYTEREALFSREGRNLAIKYAVGHPLRELTLSGKKLYYLFIPDSDSLDWANYGPTPVAPAGVRNVLQWFSDWYYGALVLLAVVGAVAFRRLKAVQFIVIVVALWAAFHVVFFAEPRFHIPLLPLAVLLAALGIGRLRMLLAEDGKPQAPVSRRERRRAARAAGR
ncbi:MAG: glycosyltransferase family 39 protein [Dehalococcoidia bacterium]|jgi:4-amino-4-deoxy-L-arabinose transferase-like glycosyltransferase